jgi:uridine kinase
MIIVGIGGGTGAGKTTLAKRIAERVGTARVVIIHQDSYYLDRSDMPLSERRKVNFDHPDAFDMVLLTSQMQRLNSGQPISQPVYNYRTHTRSPETRTIEPTDFVVLEGILVLQPPSLRRLVDIRIYVDAPDDVRFIRRLQRDMCERDRSVDEVVEQYHDTVRPMHLKFVEPTRAHADIIITGAGDQDTAIKSIVAMMDAAGRKERETHGRARNV